MNRDPAAPAKVGGFTVFTLHGVDDLEISIQTFAVPAIPGVAWVLLAASLVATAILARPAFARNGSASS